MDAETLLPQGKGAAGNAGASAKPVLSWRVLMYVLIAACSNGIFG